MQPSIRALQLEETDTAAAAMARMLDALAASASPTEESALTVGWKAAATEATEYGT